MAKKKKSRRRSYKKKRYSAPKRKAKPMGATGGLMATGVDMAFLPSKAGAGPVIYLINAVKGGVPLDAALAEVALKSKFALVDLSKWKWALGGVVISGSKKIPIVKLVAKPADDALKGFTKGKWGL